MFSLGRIIFLVALVTSAAFGQDLDERRAWLPLLMGDPSKLSADRFLNDEDPAVTRDASGRIWVAWYSCRTASARLPEDKIDLREWQWKDDGKDSVVVRWFDAKNWSKEQMVSAEPGVNWRPAIVPDEGGVRVLWTSRRGGKWAAYERRCHDGHWDRESRVPGGDDALEIRAARLADGSLLAVMKKPAPPRIELLASVYRAGAWQTALRLDEGQGRCHRASLLPLGGSEWMVAWDEERGGNYDVWTRRKRGGGTHYRFRTVGHHAGAGPRQRWPCLARLGAQGDHRRPVRVSRPQHVRERSGTARTGNGRRRRSKARNQAG